MGCLGSLARAESLHLVRFAQDVFAEQLTVGFVNLNGLLGIADRRRISAYWRGLHRMCLLNNCRVCKSEWVAWYCWQAQNHCRFAWFAQDVFAEQLTVGFVNHSFSVGSTMFPCTFS